MLVELRYAIPRRLMGAVLFSVLTASVSMAQTRVSSRRTALAPGDVVRLRIWREPDMSGDFAVSPNGHVILPRLGDLDVSTVPPDSLQSVLTTQYRVYLNNPSIEVVILRKVTISGAVRNPGVYPVEPTLTVAQAVALAGGPAADGKRDVVEVRRGQSRILADLKSDTVLADSPIQSGDQLYVPTRAWLSRNTWFVSSAITLTAILLRELAK